MEVNPDEQPLHYIFEKEGKCIFYGCDGGWFLSRAWEYMRRNCVFDAMILETTVGECPGNFRIGTHNTLPMVRLLLTALRENRMLRESTVLIGTHINGEGFEGTDDRMRDDWGLSFAYDGLSVVI